MMVDGRTSRLLRRPAGQIVDENPVRSEPVCLALTLDRLWRGERVVG